MNGSAAHGGKVLRPTSTAAAAAANGCPDALFSAEWEAYRTYGIIKHSGFTGTVDRINNDGEYDIIYMHASTTFDPATKLCAYDKDPEMVADYQQAKIPLLPNGKPDWLTFVSRWRARKSLAFSNAITQDKESPEFNGTLFTEYQVSEKESWANCSLLLLYSHRSAWGMAWANLHLLGRPNTFLAPDPGDEPLHGRLARDPQDQHAEDERRQTAALLHRRLLPLDPDEHAVHDVRQCQRRGLARVRDPLLGRHARSGKEESAAPSSHP